MVQGCRGLRSLRFRVSGFRVLGELMITDTIFLGVPCSNASMIYPKTLF